ncbi:phospholipid carrier-dependent glycosyltransferase [candidate division WWE3 bacterium]|uniref:Phospholipid carrier-dependent glycosyltransferase n=1 Tax=candidate division WWE3 bacterium TaxID=2053526 RepID=A0A7X9DKG9_UNCKA|nr:phospholipid carrier-dependent glycosyltransferase [candidate division WWE3 bacterium]
MVKYLKLYFIDTLLIILITVPTAYLRLTDLSYSDYIGDEQKSFIRLAENESLYDFFIKQRKGPMQFIVSYGAYKLSGTYRNEAAIRLPYSIISILSVITFYLLIKKLTKSKTAAFFSALLLSSNGFFVGFGRIAQYQNLNLMFSFLSLYFAYDLVEKNNKHISSAILAVIFFALSFFSHWDAIFIAPVLVTYFIKFLLRKDLDRRLKIIVLRNSLVAGALLILPFMIPYGLYQLKSVANKTYFSRRVTPGFTDINYFKFLIELYNPYVTLGFISVFAVFGALRLKKTWIYTLWFLITFFVFWYFFRKPGTHIYNFLLPAIILAGLGIDKLVKLFPKFIRFLPILTLLPVFAFFYYQSYVFFVDHTKEYPWEKKVLYVFPDEFKPKNTRIDKFVYYFLSQETPKYTAEQKLPLFGFPHNRYWNEINSFVLEQNELNNEKFTYHTNEDKSVSEWYMNVKFSDKNGFYGVGVNKPTNFVSDWSYTHYGKSRIVVKEFGDEEVKVKIYRIPPKVSSTSSLQ